MASLNKVMLIGNAGKDAEMRYTANGTAQSSFSLAVNNRRRGQSGEWEDQTEWFNIVIFGDTAERVSQYIVKGKQLYIEGRFQTRSWDNNEGVKQYRTEVIANTIQLLGSRGEAGGGGGGNDSWGDSGFSAPAARPQQANRGGGSGNWSSGSGGNAGGGWNQGDAGAGAGAPRQGGGRPPEDVDDLPFE